mgnify:CR=1 FL=1
MTDDTASLDVQLIVFEDVHLEVVRYADGWDSGTYQEKAGVVQLSPLDLKKLDIKNGSHVTLTTHGGNIVVKAKSEKRCAEGVAWLPASLYSNYLAVYDPSVSKTVMPKVTKASISPTQEDVTPIPQIIPGVDDA